MQLSIYRALDRYERQRTIRSVFIASLLATSFVIGTGLVTGVLQLPFFSYHPLRVNSPQYFTINSTVSTDFADFVPYDERFVLNAPVYHVAADLSNVGNLWQFSSLTSAERAMIGRNGFATRQSHYRQITDILIENSKGSIPNLVTSDAVLHAFHVLYDIALRETEAWSLWNLTFHLTSSMLNSSYHQYTQCPEGRWRDAALRNVMFFSVVLRLLDNTTYIPPEVEDEVAVVLDLIAAHAGISADWFQNCPEDWSQYVPRGHYTRSDLLQRYFRAMMFYGRVMFRLQPDPPESPNERGRNETAQAVLISIALTDRVTSLPGQPTGYAVWNATYLPTVFFVGDADDLLPIEYLRIVRQVYGFPVDLQHIDNDELLDTFIEQALTLRSPLILSSPLGDGESLNQTRGLRFMGQRFIPDSYFMWELVYPNVGTPSYPRLMPKGLDVMAALGSRRAWDLLADQRVYANYTEQMERLWALVASLGPEQWTQNLYWLWLYSLLPLLHEKGDGYPLFMRNSAWTDKQLMTALASWTELRHDTILYSKQSYTTVVGMPPPPPVGYVEPLPDLYGRLASLCKMMYDGLNTRSLLSTTIAERLEQLLALLTSLRSISIKELAGLPLTLDEVNIIDDAGHILESIVSLPKEYDPITSDADSWMALIADVHTDPNSGQVLEEAVGNPMVIYAVVPIIVNGHVEVILTRGGTFSYYEFEWPMNDRLTDEAWQSMLDSSEAPDMPSWVSSFVVDEAPIGLTANDAVVLAKRRCLD